MKKICVIVDPYVSCRELTEALHAEGFSCVAVLTPLTLTDVEKKRRLPSDKFIKIYDLNNVNDRPLIEELRQQNVVAVIPGSERSLHFADQLATQLAPQFSNNPANSSLRFDKFEMQEAIKKAKLPAVQHLKCSAKNLSAEQIAELKQWKFPVIVKPSNQSGSLDVHVCEDFEAINIILQKSIAQTSTFGNDTQAMVIQNYLQGTEYFVDTVSVGGRHCLSGVYRYHKISFQNHPVYRYMEIVDPLEQDAQVAIDYVFRVLDAVDLKNGLAHTEIFITATGPYLIEVNPRIAGAYGYVNKMTNLTSERGAAEMLASSLADPARFLSQNQKPLRLKKHGRIAVLQNWQEKRIFEGLAIDEIKKLSSYSQHILLKQQGDVLTFPKKFSDAVTLILLISPDKKQLEDDYEKLMVMESNGQIFI